MEIQYVTVFLFFERFNFLFEGFDLVREVCPCVVVDETAVKINGEWFWVYAAIDTETKLLLAIAVFDQHNTNSAAEFLSALAEKHDLSDTVSLVDGYGYRTALFQIGLSDQLDYTERHLIKKWFHTLKMWIDRFHNTWVGNRPSVQQWLEQFMHYYKFGSARIVYSC